MDIFNAMKNTQTVETENGATMFASSGKSIVDLNFKVPQMRANAIRGNNSINYGFFMDAYDESPEYALRWLLFSRDIRGGLGEREIFRGLIVEIAKHDLELAMKIVKDIPIEEYGRFDDMIAIYPKVNSAIQAIIVENIYNQLREDFPSFIRAISSLCLQSGCHLLIRHRKRLVRLPICFARNCS